MRNPVLLWLMAAVLMPAAGGCMGMAEMAPELARGRQVQAEGARDVAPEADKSQPTLAAEGEARPTLSVIEPRKVVYTGNFQVLAGEVNAALAATKALAEGLGGYMQRMTGSSIVVRVPAGKFYEAVAALEKLGTVLQKDITAQDVTDEHVDLELRLRNAKALRDKLEELLKKAADVKEALAVEAELARVREQIERLEGQLKVLNSRLAFATLAVAFIRAEAAPEVAKVRLPFHWLRTLGVENLLGF